VEKEGGEKKSLLNPLLIRMREGNPGPNIIEEEGEDTKIISFKRGKRSECFLGGEGGRRKNHYILFPFEKREARKEKAREGGRAALSNYIRNECRRRRD